jgi:hypothetical protein
MFHNSLYKRVFSVFAFSVFMVCSASLYAQDAGGQQTPQATDTKMHRKAVEKQKEQDAKEQKEEEEVRQQHMKDQTPAVRKRMKEDAHKADLYNGHKREFFLKRWFTKKKP